METVIKNQTSLLGQKHTPPVAKGLGQKQKLQQYLTNVSKQAEAESMAEWETGMVEPNQLDDDDYRLAMKLKKQGFKITPRCP